jgi:PAS domain S-box-containing protein
MGARALEILTAFDVVLIALSLATAILASQAALSMAGRVAGTRRLARGAWLAAGSLCLGLAVASTHFTASLVLRAQEITVYPITHAATMTAVATVGFAVALLLIGHRRPGWIRMAAGGMIAALTFAGVHFVGEHALGVPVISVDDWRYAAVVLGVAAIAWIGTSWMATRFPGGGGPLPWFWRAGSATIVGAALLATLLASFAHAVRARGAVTPWPGSRMFYLEPEAILGVAGGVLALLVAILVASTIDRRVRRTQAEAEEIRRSEDRFRSLAQATAQIVWTTDPDGQMVGEQSSWSEFTGQAAGAYTGWGWFNAIHPDDRERTARWWEETLANRRSTELQHRVRRHDGQYRHCIARLVPVLERMGRVREWVGTHTDVTDRVRMQQERDLFAEAGRVLSTSFDDRETLGAVARLLVPRHAEWCAVDVRSDDGSLRRLIAAHRDPNRAALLREIDPHLAGAADELDIRAILEGGESRLVRRISDDFLQKIAPSWDVMRRLRRLGGTSLLWVPLTARGQVLGVLTLAGPEEGEPYDLRDLALAEELARRAAVAMDNARLYATSQSAIRARDEVLGVVSHDLRNPVGTIVTASELLLDIDLPPAAQRRHLEIIRRSGKAANRLIRDLLDVSQSDSGQLAMELRPTDPGDAVAEVCELMKPLAEEKGQRLTATAPDGLPALNADPVRLQQVLSNLIGNAIKFVPRGGAIEVRAAADENAVRFSVFDTGPGIPPEDLPHLFDRHWRARDTAHLGAGLGLAISKGIVEAHGGRIWVESEVGRGTAVHLTIPAAPAPPPADRPATGERALSSGAG